MNEQRAQKTAPMIAGDPETMEQLLLKATLLSQKGTCQVVLSKAVIRTSDTSNRKAHCIQWYVSSVVSYGL